MKVFLAGASGALGCPLIRRLHDAGHEVWGLAHRPESLEIIERLGAHSVKGDALNQVDIFELIERIRPEVVIDQLTSLPTSPVDLAQRLPADCRLRLEGGGHLFEAARMFQVRRYIQQLSGFYLDGGTGLANEASPLRINAPGTIGDSARMYASLEKRISSVQSMVCIGLRYGFFYGPGTWYWPDGAFSRHLHQGEIALIGKGSSSFSFIHVDDAAQAAVAALTVPSGIYNIVDDQPSKMSDWLPAYAKWIGADAPPCLDEREGLRLSGEESVYYQNSLSGACNHKARAMLGFSPRRLPWFN
ncbi:NAD-dependent epimerase/dehydratase family protein [Acetobacter sp.]|jgi:nucleoside-diphosphate-sugar epimerase|uniref:NAD-dependent epimerase/dehydratase family protein n=1 Tax=Acetobacter sp. TaxID=440 RepID=UPI0025BCF43A|nr:NAD(P)-dependent oxidoreductase [Acetobacter sp.]MCH4090577.1 NAD(P)-dependent oxidoreductase [Acetobacter sp.]MCI1300020.1 NAD(P)-dependent oxidoreductase [Acetobacter sp.]MCI1316438.1 NAD(P)-dependent oxidoreductase [Acetobacter sp.]